VIGSANADDESISSHHDSRDDDGRKTLRIYGSDDLYPSPHQHDVDDDDKAVEEDELKAAAINYPSTNESLLETDEDSGMDGDAYQRRHGETVKKSICVHEVVLRAGSLWRVCFAFTLAEWRC